MLWPPNNADRHLIHAISPIGEALSEELVSPYVDIHVIIFGCSPRIWRLVRSLYSVSDTIL